MKRILTASVIFSLACVLGQTARAADAPQPAPPTTAPVAAADGSVTLTADKARIHGFKMHLELKPVPTLAYWADPLEYAEWPQAMKKGSYSVEITYSCPPKAGGDFLVTAAANKVTGKIEHTDDWQTFGTFKITGTLKVLNDDTSIAVRNIGRSRLMMNIRSLKLTPVAEEPVKERKKGR